jgi:2-octaprenyl-6-methoxyphenol hydroxylase
VILEAIGVWEAMAGEVTPIRTIHVSDRGRPGLARIEAAQQGVPALGYVVPNRVIGAALWPRLAATHGITLLAPAEVIAVACEETRVATTIATPAGEERITGKLLVAADGARSRVRAALGIDARTWDYRHNAVVTTVTPGEPHGNVAFERFTDSGPLALLPLGDDRLSVVWSVARERTEEILGLSDAQFLRALQEQFGYRLGLFEKAGRRYAYPLYLVRALVQARGRAILLGNAAHGLHPVAGQGFNLSLRDVAALAEAIADHPADPGASEVTAAYERWRRGDQRKVIAFTDGLVRLFTNPLPAVMGVRNAALLLFDILPGAKRAFAHHTMGRAGRLPRLARGLPLV